MISLKNEINLVNFGVRMQDVKNNFCLKRILKKLAIIMQGKLFLKMGKCRGHAAKELNLLGKNS